MGGGGGGAAWIVRPPTKYTAYKAVTLYNIGITYTCKLYSSLQFTV